jgi:hypothetical protein
MAKKPSGKPNDMPRGKPLKGRFVNVPKSKKRRERPVSR